jgi:hypothetical protein
MYNVLHIDDLSDNAMAVMHTAAAAARGSTLGNTHQRQIVPQYLAAMINTIAANQQSLYQHVALLMQEMAAMLLQA